MKKSLTFQNATVASMQETVQHILSEHQFTVLHVHDVQGVLQGKGFEMPAYRIIEFCRAPAAHQVLVEDMDIGVMLPCRFAVYQQGDDVHIVTFLPTAIQSIFPNANLGDLPQELETDILSVLEEVRRES